MKEHVSVLKPRRWLPTVTASIWRASLLSVRLPTDSVSNDPDRHCDCLGQDPSHVEEGAVYRSWTGCKHVSFDCKVYLLQPPDLHGYVVSETILSSR